MGVIDPASRWDQLSETDRILYPISCVVILLFSGVCSGLTIGIFSIDIVDMKVQQNTGSDRDRKRATRLIPLLERANLTLVTLLVSNTLAMTSLPLVLVAMCGEFVALLLSVTCLLFFGEVVPQATFVRHNVAVCSALVPFVYFCFVVTFPLSYPLSKLLDATVGSEDTSVTRATLHEAMFRAVGTIDLGDDGLAIQEINVMQGAMMLSRKYVRDLSFARWGKSFMLDAQAVVDEPLIKRILREGYSRIPVYLNSKQHVVGILLVKSLVALAFTGCADANGNPKRVIELPLREPLRIQLNGKLLDVYRAFRSGQSQMAAVYAANGTLEGFVTLEDIFSLIQQQEVRDELDTDTDSVPRDSLPSKPSDAVLRGSLRAVRQHQLAELYDSVAPKRAGQRNAVSADAA